MKIGKIENGIRIVYKHQFLMDMKISQSVLIKLDKGENIRWLVQHFSGMLTALKRGVYKKFKGRAFMQRRVFKNGKPIGIRIWRIK